MTLFVRTRDFFDVLHIYLPHPLGLNKLESRDPEALFGCIQYTRHISSSTAPRNEIPTAIYMFSRARCSLALTVRLPDDALYRK